MSASFARMVAVILVAGALVTLAGCGGGDSDSEAITTTVYVATDESSADTTATDETSTDTDAAGTSETADVGDTVMFGEDAFKVTDVQTGDTRPFPDLTGENPTAEGIWVTLTIAFDDPDVGGTSSGFHENVQLRGGDGIAYTRALSTAAEEEFKGGDDFLVSFDVPEGAVSGAVLEVGDGLHTVDSETGFGSEVDPAYAQRIDLGL